MDLHDHVRLAGAQPDVADQNVADCLGLFAGTGSQCVGATRRYRWQRRRPFTGGVGACGYRVSREGHSHFVVGGCRAPEAHGMVALEDGVVLEDVVKE